MILHYHPISYGSVESFVQKNLKPIVDAQVKQLQLLSDGLSNVPSVKNLDDIIRKLAKIKESGVGKLSAYELQTLTFHLMSIQEEDLRNYFIRDYLTENWKPIALRGLMHSILLYWNMPIVTDVRSIVYHYKADMSELQKEAFVFMSSSSADADLATHLYKNGDSILNAPQYVLLNDEMYHYPYFEGVIYAYFQKLWITTKIIALADEVLTKHNVNRFNRILLPLIIIAAHKQIGFGEADRQSLIRISTQHIGDPNDVAKWQDDTLNNDQKSSLLKARQILRTWQIIRVIDNVFTHGAATSYPERAEFWRKYAAYLLKLNDDTQPFLQVLSTYNLASVMSFSERRLFHRQLYQGKDNTAVLMRFGEYTIAEFLDGGCMYMYKNHPEKPIYTNQYAYVWTNRVHEIDDLKDATTTLITKDDIMSRYSIPDDIRIAHRGEWQRYFKHLLTMKKIIV